MMLRFINTCDKFRKTSEGEAQWQEMTNTKKEVSEKSFLKVCDISEILDEGENWEEYKENALKQHTPIKFYQSLNELYFFQYAGFEYIWGLINSRGGIENMSESNLKAVKCTCENGETWTTDINGNCSIQEIESYFVGQYFDMGIYPKEDLQKCIKVELL